MRNHLPRLALPGLLLGAALLASACGDDAAPAPPTDAAADTSASDAAAEVAPAPDATADSQDAAPAEVDAAPDVPPPACPGQPGCACAEAADCDAGPCLDLRDGTSVCAQPCADGACPAGFACDEASAFCAPVDLALCDPCGANADCQALGGAAAACVAWGDAGAFCGIACAASSDCPAGYACAAGTDVAGNAVQQCRPADDAACTCSPRAVELALATTCTNGSCAGNRACTAAGLSACDAPAPATETCNGLDDDCSGGADDAVGLCDDASACTADTCDGAAGCSHTPAPDPCDDGDPCSLDDTCVCAPGAPGGATCACAGTPKACEDGDPCTLDACGLGGACTATVVDGPCDDGEPCTSGDACVEGTCGGAPTVCDDGNPCTTDSCAAGLGCTATATTAACDDGNACTQADACQGGGCQGQAVVCDDGLGCSLDACAPASGCVVTTPEGCGVATLPLAASFTCDDPALAEWTLQPSGPVPAGAPPVHWQLDATPVLAPGAPVGCSLNANNGADLTCGAGQASVLTTADSPLVDASQVAPGSPILLRFESAGLWNQGYVAQVLVSTDDLAWTPLATVPPSGAVWGKVQLSLGAWAGQPFRVRLRFGGDCSDTTGAGWFVRNFAVFVDPCATANGGCHAAATCTVGNTGAAECACKPGWAGDGMQCADVDECAVNNGNCAQNTVCVNQPGSWSCGCAAGFQGDGVVCTDVDECSNGAAGCSAQATCSNTQGGFSCACKPGFAGDGKTCTDVNECASNNGGCSTAATCTNLAGGFACACKPGYTGDGKMCTDVNECAKNNGGCSANATCANTAGSFACTCKPGFVGNGQVCTAYGSQAAPAPSCLAILQNNPKAPTATYWLLLAGAKVAVHCDMKTDGGGWTRIDYKADLPFKQHFSGGDAWRWLPANFQTVLTPAQIAALRAVSTQGKQTYVGLCDHVVHYLIKSNNSYGAAFGFRLHDGAETGSGKKSYAPYPITVATDGCKTNGGEGGALAKSTQFVIKGVNVPLLNVRSHDSGDKGEKFGSPLTKNPAWLR